MWAIVVNNLDGEEIIWNSKGRPAIFEKAADASHTFRDATFQLNSLISETKEFRFFGDSKETDKSRAYRKCLDTLRIAEISITVK